MKSNILNNLLFVLAGIGIASAVFLILFSGLWKYRAIDQVMNETKKSNYDLTAYNCINFSKDAVLKLQSKNINSNIIVIKEDPTKAETHAVIGIWLDPQNGNFITNSEYVGDYTELKSQFGWAR